MLSVRWILLRMAQLVYHRDAPWGVRGVSVGCRQRGGVVGAGHGGAIAQGHQDLQAGCLVAIRSFPRSLRVS
jgi:hypothetical protein